MERMDNGDASKNLSPLGDEIQKHLDKRGWSQRTLAMYADIGSGTVTRVMHGTHATTPKTLQAIADALEINVEPLMRLAGINLPVPAKERHQTAEYIAQQLHELPPYYRELAIEAVAGMVDAFRRVARGEPANGLDGQPILPPHQTESTQPQEPGAAPSIEPEVMTMIRSAVTQLQEEGILPMGDKVNDTAAQKLAEIVGKIIDKGEKGVRAVGEAVKGTTPQRIVVGDGK
jgi:transcriptional regulator with XRE-family HTH domain